MLSNPKIAPPFVIALGYQYCEYVKVVSRCMINYYSEHSSYRCTRIASTYPVRANILNVNTYMSIGKLGLAYLICVDV